MPAVYATNSNLAYAGSCGTGEGKRACTWACGGGATIVLEDLGADAPATVTRAEFGMCAGDGVRSPTSSKVQEAGPSHGLGRGVPFAAFEVPGVFLAFWARGRCRDSGHRAEQFESQTVRGN